MTTKPSFNPTQAQWAQIRNQPGKLVELDSIGPVVYHEISAEQAKALPELLANLHNLVGPETSLEGLENKRPMIERTYVFIGQDKKSLRELTHKQFKEWATAWMLRAGFESVTWGALKTTPEEREDVLRRMVTDGISPTMLLQ